MDACQFFEYIVIGCGGVGSGTVYWLSKRAGKGNIYTLVYLIDKLTLSIFYCHIYCVL